MVEPQITSAELETLAQKRVNERALARRDPMFLGREILSYDHFVPEVHNELFACYPRFDEKKPWLEQTKGFENVLVLWARGHLKTTTLVVICIQAIINNPDIRILLMQGSIPVTRTLLKQIASHFEGTASGSRFKELFPEFCGTRKELGLTSDKFTTPARKKNQLAQATVTVASPKSVKTGQHYDLGVFDDLVNDQNFRSPTQLKKIEEDYQQDALNAMRTSATDNLSSQYQNAQKALNNELNTKNGGSDLPSGTDAQLQAGLQMSEAQDQANAQNTITMNNANLANTNMWNAFNVLSGNVASQFNPLGYAGAYNQGSGTVGNLSQAVTNSRQSGLLGTLGGVTGSLLGAAGNAGGFGSLFCWVAASFFGWNSAKTRFIRLWMLAKAPKWFSQFYIKHGEAIAKTPIRWAFRPVFEYVLARYA